MKHRWTLIGILGLTLTSGMAQKSDYGDSVMLKAIDRIQQEPQSISFSNAIPINTEGGHLQGIQTLWHHEHQYIILTGSSSTIAYYTLVELQPGGKVISVNKILDMPFKHAGGFQIDGNYMAIGIEDNEARNQSLVFIYDLSTFPFLPPEPTYQIERNGDWERATAGCTALHVSQEKVLIIVGDWNSRHLDFYLAHFQKDSLTPFDLIQSITMADVDKNTWCDPEWLGYQNINLYRSGATLYLLAMTSDLEKNNILDVYRLNQEMGPSFTIHKIARKTLPNRGGDFISAAGIEIRNGAITGIYSSDRNITSTTSIYYYALDK